MNTKIIKLDINKRLYEVIRAKQGDTQSRFLLFHLLDGAIPFSLNGRTVRVYGLKPDNKEIFNDLQIVDATRGICKLELTSQALAVPGNLDLELVIMEGESKLSSIPFVVEVLKSLNSKSAIESSNEYKALDRSLIEVEAWNKEFAEKSGKLEELYTPRLNEVSSQLEDIPKQSYITDKATKVELEKLDLSKADKTQIGSPLIAYSVAEMVDKTKVYVYKGVESGYINGNWYSWNGTAWISGGVYNSQAIGVREVGLEKLTTASTELFKGQFYNNSAILLNSDGKTVRLGVFTNGVCVSFEVPQEGIYKIKKIGISDRFRVVGMRSVPMFNDTNVDVIYNIDDSLNLSEIEIEVTGDIKYIVIYTSGNNQQIGISANRVNISKKYLDKALVSKTKSEKNLYNNDNAIYGLIEGSSIDEVCRFNILKEFPDAKVCITELEPNKTYTIKAYEGDRNRYVIFNSYPKLGSIPNRKLFVQDGNMESFTFTNDDNGKYLMTYLSSVGENVKCQVEKGTQVTTYEPYYFIDKSLLPEQEKEKPTQTKKFFALGSPQLYFSTNTIDPSILVTSDILAIYNSVNSNLVTKKELGVDGIGNKIYEYTVEKPIPKTFETDGKGGIFPVTPIYNERMKMKILLNSGTHGDEKGSALGLALFFKELITKTDNETLNFIKNNAILKFIPVLNPSGYNSHTRHNHRGYDLNRDFENLANNETKIATSWINSNTDSIACIDYHNSSRTLSFWPAMEDQIYHELFYNVISNLSDKWCQDNPALNNPVGELMISPIKGNMNTYAHRKGMIGITVEGSRHSSTLNSGSNSNFDAMAVKYGNDLLVNTIVAIMMYSR